MAKTVKKNDIDEYANLISSISNPLSVTEERKLFRILKNGSTSGIYRMSLNPCYDHKKYLKRLGSGEIRINYSSDNFDESILDQIESSRGIGIKLRYDTKGDSKKIYCPLGFIEYNLERAQGGVSPRIDRLEPHNLYLKIRNEEAEEAKKRIIQGNLRYVVRIAKGYTRLAECCLEDLVSQGNLGLINAVDGFDVDRGLKFSTFSTHSISQSIGDYIAKNMSQFKTNADVYERTKYIEKVEEILYQKSLKIPTPEELMNEIKRRKKEGKGISRQINISIIQDYQKNRGSSFTNILGGDTIFEIPKSENGFEEVDREDFMNYIYDQCSAKERELLARRYGLDGYEPEEYRDLGKSIGLGHESTRQKVKEIMDKLVV